LWQAEFSYGLKNHSGFNEAPNLVPHALRCAKCQSLVEKYIDYHQYIDEGLAGTREAHKHIRGGLLSDMIKRGKE
jgi:hypothetical protein